MNATIKIDGLRKRFGPVQALDGMTFTVRPGQVTGFVGPNSAGKSTTMRVIVGLDAPDAGTATIGGRPYHSLKNPLRHVGSLLDAGALQPSRSARDHLLWLAHSQGLQAGRVDEVIALAGLESAARRRAGGYSLGMRQRLGIAAALLGDPAVLIFDEPFNGMDPEGIVWMKGFLRVACGAGPRGPGVQPPDERTARHRRPPGRHRPRQGDRRHLRHRSHRRRIRRPRNAAHDGAGRRQTVLAGAGAEVAATGSGVLTVSKLSSERVVAILASHAIPFSEVSAHRVTLEQAYMELTSQSVEYRAEATS